MLSDLTYQQLLIFHYSLFSGRRAEYRGNGTMAQEKGRAVRNRVIAEVRQMIAAAWLILSGLMYSLQLSTGSFPKPLTAQEEQHYLELSAQGDLEARNVLIERNLRLVAHIMNNG